MKRIVNKYEAWYMEQIKYILSEGQFRGDRTGTGVYSVPSIHYTHDLRESYPAMNGRFFNLGHPQTEMIWMMSGSSNIQYLLDNGCPFWTEFATKGETRIPNALSRAERINIYATQKGVSYHEALLAFAAHEYAYADEMLDSANIPNTQDDIIPAGELGPVYGVQWRYWPNPDGTTFDQLQYALDTLRKDPNSRRIVVDCWNPSFLPDPAKSPRANAAEDKMALTPCHFTFGFYTNEIPFHKRAEQLLVTADPKELAGLYPIRMTPAAMIKYEELFKAYRIPTHYLDINFVMRSNDWILGQPANMNMYSALLMMYAKELNMVPRYVNYTGWDAHIYSNHLEGVEELQRRWDSGETDRTTNVKMSLNEKKGLYNYHKTDFIIDGEYKPLKSIKFPIAI